MTLAKTKQIAEGVLSWTHILTIVCLANLPNHPTWTEAVQGDDSGWGQLVQKWTYTLYLIHLAATPSERERQNRLFLIAQFYVLTLLIALGGRFRHLKQELSDWQLTELLLFIAGVGLLVSACLRWLTPREV